MRQMSRTIAGTVAALLVVALPALAAKTIQVPSDAARTIPLAMISAKAGDTVMVDDGVYKGRFFIEPGVILKSRRQYGAVLDGKSSGTVVTLGRMSELWGFEVRNGTIGVFAKHPGNVIRDCRIVKNWQTGIICVRQLAVIQDNVIAFNGGSGIQTWDARSAGKASIDHNVIAFNANHGIAMGGKSEGTIAYNIIAFNERFAVKSGGPDRGVVVKGNDLFGNLWTTGPLPSGNLSYDPKFMAAAGMNFTPGDQGQCKECKAEERPGVRENSSGGRSGTPW